MKRPGFEGLNFANILWAKRASGFWHPDVLRELYRRPLPPLERLPPRYEMERQRNRPVAPIQIHSDEAEALLCNAFFLPTWKLTKLLTDKGTRWEVVEQRGAKLVVLGKGETDVEACREALEKHGGGR